MCFDMSDVELFGDFEYDEFGTLSIALVPCRNGQGVTCASEFARDEYFRESTMKLYVLYN